MLVLDLVRTRLKPRINDGFKYLTSHEPEKYRWAGHGQLSFTKDPTWHQDGMPDAWETLAGLNPNLASDALADPDEDGAVNRDEYLRDTDPHQVDGPLRVTVQAVSSDTVRIRFPGQRGLRYRIERIATLSPAHWQTLASGLVDQGNMVSITNALSGQNQGFLRVVADSSL